MCGINNTHRGTPPSPLTVENRKKVVSLLLVSVLAAAAIALFATGIQLWKTASCKGQLSNFVKINTAIWGAVSLPLGLFSLINICSLPCMKCKEDEN